MQTRYSATAKFAHWLIFILVVAQYIAARNMGNHNPGQPVDAASNVHASIGVLIVALALWRLLARLSSPVAPSPEIPRWQQIAGHAVHKSLYLLLIAMPIFGLLAAANEGAQFTLFGMFVLPSLVQPESALGEFGEKAHEILAPIIFLVVALHVAAALFHRFVRRDGVLARMLP